MKTKTITIPARSSIKRRITNAVVPVVLSVTLETVVEFVESDVERKIPIALLISKV